MCSLLQYDESKYTKKGTLSLDAHTDIIEFLSESPWILKMPFDHRATTKKKLTAEDKSHKQ